MHRATSHRLCPYARHIKWTCGHIANNSVLENLKETIATHRHVPVCPCVRLGFVVFLKRINVALIRIVGQHQRAAADAIHKIKVLSSPELWIHTHKHAAGIFLNASLNSNSLSGTIENNIVKIGMNVYASDLRVSCDRTCTTQQPGLPLLYASNFATV